jgi:Trk K+ transport system NAD-binding subunit
MPKPRKTPPRHAGRPEWLDGHLSVPETRPSTVLAPPLRRPGRVRIYLRYVQFLLWEFRWSLAVFWSLVVFGGLVLTLAYHDPGQPQGLGFGEACYAIFMLIFLESYLTFPREWYLQPLFFLLPVIGLGAVADSLIRLAFLTFSSKQKLPEWQRMVASLYRQHIVVVGVGKVGYEIIKGLLALREPVVAVERQSADSALLDEVIDLKVPVIRGDGRTLKTLEQAGVARARAVVLATSDDLTNLDSGLTARDLNAEARIVLRLFDESLAVKVRGAFAMPAISTALVSSPAFIAAATGRSVYQGFKLAGQHLYLIDMTVSPGGGLVGRTVGQIQADRQVNIVMHNGPAGVNVNPGHELVLRPNDEVLVIAPMERLIDLETQNRPADSSSPRGAPTQFNPSLDATVPRGARLNHPES